MSIEKLLDRVRLEIILQMKEEGMIEEFFSNSYKMTIEDIEEYITKYNYKYNTHYSLSDNQKLYWTLVLGV